jgi:hypothetical protein
MHVQKHTKRGIKTETERASERETLETGGEADAEMRVIDTECSTAGQPIADSSSESGKVGETLTHAT